MDARPAAGQTENRAARQVDDNIPHPTLWAGRRGVMPTTHFIVI